MINKPFLAGWRMLGITCVVCMNMHCKSKSGEYEPTYSTDTIGEKILLFGVSNLAYYKSSDLFVSYLNENLEDVKVRAVPSSSVAGFDAKLQSRYFNISTGSGVQAVESAGNGYHIIAASVNSTGTGGVILLNKDSAINTFSDLRNKTIATVGAPALPGHMLQMLYLKKNGIDVKKESRLIYVESFESVYLNLYLGKCSAGFSSTSAWYNLKKDRPEIAARLQVKWEMPGLINSCILIRNDMTEELANQVETLVLTMHQNEKGKKALAKLGFLRYDPADSNTYQPVKVFLKEYNVVVGKE